MPLPTVRGVLAGVSGAAAGAAPRVQGRELRERSEVGVDVLELFVEVLSQSQSGEVFYDRLCEAVCRLAHMRRALIFRYDDGLLRGRGAGGQGPHHQAVAAPHV